MSKVPLACVLPCDVNFMNGLCQIIGMVFSQCCIGGTSFVCYQLSSVCFHLPCIGLVDEWPLYLVYCECVLSSLFSACFNELLL